jgi:hypothetical protein
MKTAQNFLSHFESWWIPFKIHSDGLRDLSSWKKIALLFQQPCHIAQGRL